VKKTLDRIVDRVTLVLAIFSAVMFACIIVVLLLNIILRSAFNSGVFGQYEIVQYGIMSCVGLGVSRTTYTNRHIHVNLLVDKLNWRARSAVEFIGRAICTVTYGFATYPFIATAKNAARYFKITDLYHIPFQYVYWVFFVILVITTLVFFYQMCVYFAGIFVNYDELEKSEISGMTDAGDA